MVRKIPGEAEGDIYLAPTDAAGYISARPRCERMVLVKQPI